MPGSTSPTVKNSKRLELESGRGGMGAAPPPPPSPRPPLGLVSLFSKSLALFKLEPGEVRIRFVLFSLTTFQNTLVLIQIM